MPFTYTLTPGEKVDQLDTPASNKTTVLPGGNGARYLRIAYTNIDAAAGKRLYVVFNALNSVDADTKLGVAGQRFVIPIGSFREWYFDENDELTRLDFCSDAAAETTDSLVTYEYGVKLA